MLLHLLLVVVGPRTKVIEPAAVQSEFSARCSSVSEAPDRGKHNTIASAILQIPKLYKPSARDCFLLTAKHACGCKLAWDVVGCPEHEAHVLEAAMLQHVKTMRKQDAFTGTEMCEVEAGGCSEHADASSCTSL